MKTSIIISGLLLFLLFCSPKKASSQLCQGSLGDPVVNITFGAGSNPGAPLNNLTNYTYLAADCPNDGSYTVANKTSNCFAFTWHSVQEDHTPGDTDGYMMIVNASNNPGDFFVKRVEGLCPNTTYEFASWILNVLKQSSCGGAGIKPNITFAIETTTGIILQTYKTGDIPAGNFPEWKQYGFFFKTTAGENSVVLRMTNNAPGGCGNDLLLDDITFRACGPLVTASINGSPDSVDICTGNNSVYTLSANVSAGYYDPVYQWQVSTTNGASWINIAGANNKIYVRPSVATPATYLYRFAVFERSNLNVSSCSILSNIVAISVNKFPEVAATNHGNCAGDTLFFNANDGASYVWTGPMNFSSNNQSPFIPNAVTGNSGKYYVTVTSDKGCTSKDSTIATVNIKPVINAGDDVEICEGKSTQLNGTGINITKYQWVPSSNISDTTIPNPIVSPTQNTLYILTVFNKECKSSDSVMITVNKIPIADAGPDKVILKGQSVILNGFAAGTDIVYEWAPPDYITGGSTLTPVVNPPANSIYTLRVTSNKGCGIAVDDVRVKVFKNLFIPNAFTPNGDGVNDTWNIETLKAFPNAEVKVFNRFGQIVFYNHGINNSWDGKFKGKALTSGAYPYIIDLKNNLPVIKGVVFIVL